MRKAKSLMKNQYVLEIVSLFVVMLLAFSINEKWNYAAGILIIFYSLTAYIIISLKEKDWFILSAIILPAWLCPLGLSLFRLASYQKPWEIVTWICYFLLPACFIVGYAISKRVLNSITSFITKKAIIRNNFSGNKNANILFWFAIIWFVLGLITILAKWYAAGILPFFSDDYYAYSTFIDSRNYIGIGKALENVPVISSLYNLFLLKGWIFFYPLWIVPPILTIYAKKNTNKISIKILCHLLSVMTIIFTMLAVSRELYLMIFVTMAVVLYNLYGKRLIIIIIMLIASVGGYAFLSSARNASTEEVNQIMYITENPNYDPEKGTNADTTVSSVTGETGSSEDAAVSSVTSEVGSSEVVNEIADDSAVDNNNDIKYSKPLPGIIAWAYGYFTVGYDNMNHLVKTLDKHLYGAMQLNPLFVITGPSKLRYLPEVLYREEYQVAPGLTVYTFMFDPYVDFGIIGVVISMVIWGIVFGLTAEGNKKYGNSLNLIILACFVHHIVFISFVNWMSNFPYDFSIGIIIVLYLVMKFKRNNKLEVI